MAEFLCFAHLGILNSNLRTWKIMKKPLTSGTGVGPTCLAPGTHEPFSKYLLNETRSQKVVWQKNFLQIDIYGTYCIITLLH